MELEHPLLKVPVEDLQRNFRNTKRRVDRELDGVLKALEDAGRALPPAAPVKAPPPAAAAAAASLTGAGQATTPPAPPAPSQPSAAEAAAATAAAATLRDAAERLRVLGTKVADAASNAAALCATAERRLGHLTAPAARAPKHGPRQKPYSEANLVPTPEVAARRAWERTRLARLIVDYILRAGYPGVAGQLAAAAGVEWLVDVDAYAESRAITDALRGGDPGPLLRWCAANERRLSKAGSLLELRARTQVFVELVRSRKLSDAIGYAKAHIVPGCMPHSKSRLLRAMALLAFPPDTTVSPYAEMYAEERWEELADAFREDYYALHGLTRVAVLETVVKAGLASLKTRYCAGEPLAPQVLAGDGVTLVRQNVDCPVCCEPYREMAAELPFAYHLHSSMVCALSRRPMDDDNLPLMLPNGNVYSHLAISMAAMRGKGVFTDPRTGDKYEYPQTSDDGRGSLDRIRRVYVM